MTWTGELWSPLDATNPRLSEGFRRQRQRRDAAIAGGARPIGWKIGVNDPRVRAQLGLTSSVIGYLVEDSLLPLGRDVSLHGATRPGAELELAFRLRVDVPPDAAPTAAAAAIGAIAPAIEIIDIDPARVTDLTEALARNVWHRSALIGPAQPWSEGLLDQISVRLARPGDTSTGHSSARAAIQDAGSLIRFVAGATALLGAKLCAGDWVLSGLLVPSPLWLTAGDRIQAEYGPLGTLSVSFT